MSSLSNTQYNSRSMNGLINVNANTGTFTDLEVNNLIVNQSGTAPTMPTNDNSTAIATTAFVQSHTSGNYVDLTGTQTITGQKTFSNANTYVTGNLVTNSIQADASTNNINIGTSLTTGDVNIGTTSSTGQNVALNWGTTSNSGQLTFRGGSFTLSSTGNYTQQSGGSLTTSIDNNKTTGAFNMLTGSTWSGTANIGSNATATGTFNIGASGTNTYLNGTNTINTIKGKYIDLFAGQLRMFSGSGGGSSISLYVPPSGRTIMDFSSTDCDMVGQYNLTSNNITCSIAPTTNYEYVNKLYVDNTISSNLTNYVTLSTAQDITGTKTIKDTSLTFKSSFLPSQSGSIAYNGLNQSVNINSTNNFAIQAGGSTTYSNGTGIYNIKSSTLGTNTKLYLNDNYDNALMLFDCSATGSNTINSYRPLIISATNPSFTSNARCSIAPSNSDDYCNKTYVDSAVSGGLSGYVSIAGTQTITGAKTFNDFTVNQNGGSNINMTINTVGSDNFYFNFSTLAQLRYHYVNALNKIIVDVPTAGKKLGFNLAGTEYLRLDSALTGGAGVLVNKLTTGVMDYQANNININTASVDMNLSLQGTNYITLNATTSKVTLAPTRCASYLEVVGEIQANNPIEVTYNPSSISAGRIGYQVLYNWNTLPVVGGTNQIGGGPFNFPAVGVWNCELYVGWAQTSNNRAISISLNTLIDYTRAQFSTQQNSSYQQLNLTTIISVTSTATNYYLLQQCGSNTGSFNSTQQQYFRITRIA